MSHDPEITIIIYDPRRGHHTFARLQVFDAEVGNQGETEERLKEPEIIGDRAALECLLERIAVLYPILKKERAR